MTGSCAATNATSPGQRLPQPQAPLPGRSLSRLATLCKSCLLLIFVGALAMGACSVKEKTTPVAVNTGDWDLSDDAQSTYYYLLLEEARRDNNATLGEEAILKLVEIDDSPDVFLEGATFFWQLGDSARTRLLVEEGQARHPNHLQLQLLLAQIYITEQRYDEAQALLQTYLEKNPKDDVARAELASMLVQDGGYQQALDILKPIPESETPASIAFVRAKAYAGLEQFEVALPILKKILHNDPEFVDAWAELALLYETTKDFEGADATYRSIMKLGEPSRELVLRLAEVNVKLGKPEQAVRILEKAPQDLASFMPVAGFLLDAKQYDIAETFLEETLNKYPQFEELWFHKAVLYYDGRNDSARALAALQRIPENNRFHERSQRFSIHLLFEAGRKEEALALARQSRAKYQDITEFWLLEARLLNDLGQTKAAIDLLGQARDRWGEESEVLYTLALVLDKAGRKKEAFTIMDELLELEPENADALNYVGYTLADENRELERALSLIQQALAIKPDNDYIMDSLAWAQYRLGQLDAAWESIQQAVVDARGNEVKDPEIWDHYGDIAKALGKLSEAREAYTKALKYKHKDPETVRAKLQAL